MSSAQDFGLGSMSSERRGHDCVHSSDSEPVRLEGV